MGLFDFPRIHVFGTHLTNPGTGNNDSASPGTELTVVSNTERVQAMTQGMTDAQFEAWMTGLDKYGLLRAQWNYYGDFGFRFIDVRVRSVQLSPDRVVTDPAADPFIGAQVYLNDATMCDANPEGFTSTQVFSESLEIRSPRVLGSGGSFISRKPTRATTRWLNWYRNVSYHGLFGLPPDGANGKLSSGGAGGASASFQCGIEIRPHDLKARRGDTADRDEVLHKLLPRGSKALSELVDVLKRRDALGLLFRYNIYLCFPKFSDTDLAVEFAAGRKLANPAYGLVLGTIAPWFEGEPSTIAMGRNLKPCAPFTNPYRPMPYYLSPVVARVDTQSRVVSLDMANCLPEDGPEGDKFNLGTVVVGLRKATVAGEDPAKNTNPVVPIGPMPNDRQTYVSQGGIYDVSYDHLARKQQAWLDDDGYELVLQTGLGGVLLSETPYMVASDSGCNYLDALSPGESWTDPAVREQLAKQPAEGLRGDIDIHVRRRGKVPRGRTAIRVEQWRETPTGLINEYGVYRYPALLRSETLTVAGGVGRYTLTPAEGTGLRLFRFVPPGNFPQEISPNTLAQLAFQEFFVELRVLPFDDYRAVREEELTFDLIYNEIFRYYRLVLPAMSERLDLSNPTIWQTPTAARYVLRMVDEQLWAFYNYMPRTRDLSKYRRDLLRRFCLKVLGQTDAPGVAHRGPSTAASTRTV
jgi:hypothetical protein